MSDLKDKVDTISDNIPDREVLIKQSDKLVEASPAVGWKQFLEENKDCPEAVYKLAETPFQKQTAVEFFKNEADHQVIQNTLKMHEKLLIGIFGVVLLGLLADWIGPILGKLLGLG